LDEADHLANQIVIIDHGRVVASGPPAQLKRRTGGKVLEVRPRHERDLGRLSSALAQMHGTEVRVDEATRFLRLTVEDDESFPIVLRAIETTRIEVDEMALRQPKLEEVFLALTDHSGLTPELD